MRDISWPLISAISTAVLITISKAVLNNSDPYVFGLVLMFGVAFVSVIYVLKEFGINKFKTIVRENLTFLLLVGVCGFSINALTYVGLQRTSSINLALIGRTDIIFTALLGSFLFGEKINKAEWGIFGVILFGVIMVMDIIPAKFTLNLGDLFILASVIFLACNAQTIRYKLVNVPRSIIALFNSGICAILFFITAMLTNRWHEISMLNKFKIPMIVAILLQLTIFVTYYKGLSILPTWLVRSIYLIIPAINLILGIAFLKETISIWQIYGLILIAGGVLSVSYLHKAKALKQN